MTLRRLSAFRRVSARGCCGRREAAVTSCAASAPRPCCRCCARRHSGRPWPTPTARLPAWPGWACSTRSEPTCWLIFSRRRPASARSASQDAPDLTRSLEAEISRAVGEVLDAGDAHAGELRSDIAMVMREIDAGGTVFRAAIEAGDEELEREVLAAFEALGAEFGDMAFMLADLARAAGEIQDSLGGQDAELRAAGERTDPAVGRRAHDPRGTRGHRAAGRPVAAPNPPPRARAGTAAARTAGCCPTTRRTRRCSAAGSGWSPSWRASSPGPGSSWSPAPRRRQDLAAAGRPGARAGPWRAGARVAGLAGGQPHRDRAAAHRPGRRAGGAGRQGSGRHQAAAGRRAGPGAPADPRAHQRARAVPPGWS